MTRLSLLILKVLLILIFAGWVALWVLKPTEFWTRKWKEAETKSSDSVLGYNGLDFVVWTFPLIVFSVIGFIYLELKPSTQRNREGRSAFTSLSSPLLVNPYIGVLSGVQILTSSLFIMLLLWTFFVRVSNDLKKMTPVKSFKLSPWQYKLFRMATRCGLLSEACLALLLLPVLRGMSIFRFLGVQFEASVRYHVWLGTGMVFLATLHGAGTFFIWGIKHRIQDEMWKWQKKGRIYLAGEIALATALIMSITALPQIRRKWFQLFYYTHHLYVEMVMASKSSVGGGSGSGGGGSSRTRVGRYELGRTLGEGTFAKVKFARNLESGENVAIKILDKEKVLKHKMIGQIKREISTMKLIRHPNVIRMYEVMASKTKIYIVMEFVTGGELFDKIASRGRLKEDEARKYFQQLINAVDYCHSRGVYHRDLKPENLLLDARGTLKVSDFGLSALPQQVREDGLLHTTCGTPNYVAPEVINNKGYDGAKADLWSCGVILFVLMAGYLPFEETNLVTLYKKIFKADFTCPSWFSSSAKKLIKRILDPNPSTRITISEVLTNEWFKKGFKPPIFEQEEVTLDDVNAIFNESADSPNLVVERRDDRPPTAPVTMNAFELISTSQGLNLSSLFEKQMGLVKRETRFTSKSPATEIISKIEQAATPMGFDVKKNNYKMKLYGEKLGRKGHLSIATEIFEVAPSLHMVELRKAAGDTLEFHKFYKNLSTGLKDIVWKTGDEENDGTDISMA